MSKDWIELPNPGCVNEGCEDCEKGEDCKIKLAKPTIKEISDSTVDMSKNKFITDWVK